MTAIELVKELRDEADALLMGRSGSILGRQSRAEVLRLAADRIEDANAEAFAVNHDAPKPERRIHERFQAILNGGTARPEEGKNG